MQPHEKIAARITAAKRPALIAFLTAGYPSKNGFLDSLLAVSNVADTIEIGVPFSDPMADGVTIQRSSETAIANGVSLRWILDTLRQFENPNDTPLLLMSYLNPLLAYGFEQLAEDAMAAGVSGFMVPDLPNEECEPLRTALSQHGLALVQFVTPATPRERLQQLCHGSQGFIYAVTKTGITGGQSDLPEDLAEYLANIKDEASIPVCAGFGVRSVDQVKKIAAHADGVIVGSALVEVLESGDDPALFLQGLRPTE